MRKDLSYWEEKLAKADKDIANFLHEQFILECWEKKYRAKSPAIYYYKNKTKMMVLNRKIVKANKRREYIEQMILRYVA